MGRRHRSLFGLVIFGCGAVALYLWRSRRMRDYARAFLAPASDCVRDFVKKALKQQAGGAEKTDAQPKLIVTGLAAPEARPLTSLNQLLSWSSHAATDPDGPFCQTYNAPLMLPTQQPPRIPATTSAFPATGSIGGTAFLGTTGRRSAVALPPLAAPPPAATTPFAVAAASAGAADGGGGGGGGRPRLLVCHDMMGGYLEDRWVQGAADPGFFRLWQWDQIDVFIYFSHHLVTLPPPGWIAAAHRNGVRVLGTFITEWSEGRALCEALLASASAARAAADRLVALAAHWGFEGWLVNIENGLRRDLVPHLGTFLGHLRARMAAVVGPAAMVVWYDAITTEGRLQWQDGLTALNAPFFDAADALFVNYRWQEGAPAAAAAAAGGRAADVYLGVDVFGRGSYGGGKDNCPAALAAARSAGVSAALFAPGWVFEEFARDMFEERQERFWERIRAVWPARPAVLQRLPLATCFNGGAGRGVWVEGVRVSSAPWFNLAAQDIVAATTLTTTATTTGSQQAPAGLPEAPSPSGPVLSLSPLQVRPTQQLALCGGSCLALQLAPPEKAEAGAAPGGVAGGGPWLHDLFSAHLVVPAVGLDLSYTAACSGASRVAVLLRTAPVAKVVGAGGNVNGPRVGSGGVVVGPWGPGDRAVVEALQRRGYTCITCPAAPLGTTTRPLPEPGAPAVAVAVAAAAPMATAAASVPVGLPWVTCCAHLPYELITGPAGGGGATAVITAVGVVCYQTAATVAAAAGPAMAGGGAAGGGGSGSGAAATGRASARGSAMGYTAAATATATAAMGGDGGPCFQAFLGRLALREHRPGSLKAVTAPQPEAAAAAAAPPAAAPPVGPLGLLLAAPVELAAAVAAPLSGCCCYRVRWGRPGDSRPRSLRAASFNSLTGMGAAAVVANDARVSGELVDSHDDEEDEDWERSSGGGGGGGDATGGSPVKVVAPGAVGAAGEGECDDSEGEGDVTAVGAEDARLLTCELSWEPQFEEYGTPRHRSYHVWSHFSVAEAPTAVAAAPTGAASGRPLPPVPSPAAGAVAAAAPPVGVGAERSGGGGNGSAEAREGAWEVLHPDWSGAVWVGEAFVARYRLVQLEVPGWARTVTLLVQPVTWQAAEPAALLQPLAYLRVPQQQ